MRILLIKTSSMGDVIHTLPALTDAGKIFPAIRFDWIVEEHFAEIPAWHPLVDKVMPVALRRWRKNIFSPTLHAEWKKFHRELHKERYDFIIDAQGLLKSAWLTYMAKGVRCGPNWQSAREPLASLFYQRKFSIAKAKEQHAITRMRSLFSAILGYPLPTTIPEYGIAPTQKTEKKDYLVFLHGTTWNTKHWPEEYWIELTKIANQHGWLIKLPWGNQHELERAQRIATQCKQVEILPRLDLIGIASVLANAKAIVSVDTGLGHLAAALDVPTISLYGPTNPVLTGTQGKSQQHLSAKFTCAPCLSRKCIYPENSSLYPVKPPCFTSLPPMTVWQSLVAMLQPVAS